MWICVPLQTVAWYCLAASTAEDHTKHCDQLKRRATQTQRVLYGEMYHAVHGNGAGAKERGEFMQRTCGDFYSQQNW